MMNRTNWILLTLIVLTPILGQAQILDQPPVEACKPGDFAVIGYPARDSRNDAFVMADIFRNIYNVKRLQPGGGLADQFGARTQQLSLVLYLLIAHKA